VILSLILFLMLAAGAGLLACAAAPEGAGPGLSHGALRPCPSTPNCVCSEGPAASIEPLAFEGDPDRAFDSLLEFLSAEPRISDVTRAGDYAHAVARTTFFRDDLELRLDREARCIHVRSASRVGYSDLGVNRRRVESIRARWRAPDTR
jgi:uncharacterized protein (DUF1499 family)